MTDKEQIIVDGVDVKNCRRRIGQNNYCRYFKRLCSENNFNCVWKQLARKTQECEKLKKQLMQKSEVDMFFNTPIEGWSNDPCGICPHKAENEELKKEIINKNEKIKELRFSVSDLTNRLCYLNAEKSFRIVDLEQALEEIERFAKENDEMLQGYHHEWANNRQILEIIHKAKDGNNE